MIVKHQQFDFCGKKTFEKAVIQTPFRFAYQMPDEACFFYLTEGRSNIIAPTSSIEFQSKEGVVMNCGNYFAEIYAPSEEVTHCEAIAVHLHPDIIKMLYEKDIPSFIDIEKTTRPAPINKVKASELLKNYINSLEFYFNNPALVSEELLGLKLKELLLLLAKTDNLEAIKTLIGSLFNKEEADFKAVIEANLFNHLSIEDLAALTNLSLSSFKRTFSKHYQISPARYIKLKRLERASQLLKNTNSRISDIAYDCGFVDLAHFSRSFHAHFDCSPSNFRLN